MKHLIPAVLIALFAAPLAHTADPTCETKAAEKKLAGAAKVSFIKKCEADAKGGGAVDCAALADAKKLHGAARTSYIKKCEADPKGAAVAARCETAAAERKLYGAARDSFVKKCMQDTAGR